MESHDIRFSNGLIHYSIFGKGPKNVIAFHGFGQDGSVFQSLADHFPEYRIIAVDLPFHGNSTLFDSAKPLTSLQVVQIKADLQKQEGYNRFSILAFSIGARLTLPLIESFAGVLDEVILIAPEGLHSNIWFNLSTDSYLSRRLFKFVIARETLTQNILAAGYKMKLINRSTEVMAKKSVSTTAKRHKVYNTWVSLRLLRPDFAKMQESISKYGIPVQIILGERDDIIRPCDIKRAITKMPGSRITILACGHHQLISHYEEWKSQQKND